MLKAYLIVDKYYSEEEQVIVFAETPGKAKLKGLECCDSFYDYDFTELRAERQKDFDKYAETQRIPIKELLDRGWWFCCVNCGEQINEDNIADGEAFINSEEDEYTSFVKGTVICDGCHKKVDGGANGI